MDSGASANNVLAAGIRAGPNTLRVERVDGTDDEKVGAEATDQENNEENDTEIDFEKNDQKDAEEATSGSRLTLLRIRYGARPSTSTRSYHHMHHHRINTWIIIPHGRTIRG